MFQREPFITIKQTSKVAERSITWLTRFADVYLFPKIVYLEKSYKPEESKPVNTPEIAFNQSSFCTNNKVVATPTIIETNGNHLVLSPAYLKAEVTARVIVMIPANSMFIYL